MSNRETGDPASLIVGAVLRLGRRLRAARPDGSVNLSTLALLTTLHRKGAMAAAQLAREERLQPQSLTRLLAAMEGGGLIERRRDEVDQRALIIEITRLGRSVVARDLAARRAWLERTMDMALTLEERAQLTEAAALMQKVAGEEGSAARAFRRMEGPAASASGEAVVIPGVYYDDARAGVAWLEDVLGLELVEAYEGPGGKIAFAQMMFGSGVVFVSTRSTKSAWSEVGKAAICLVAADGEEVKRRYEQAAAAGAEFVRRLHLSVSPAFPRGVQQFDARDPEGNLWTVSEHRPRLSAKGASGEALSPRLDASAARA